MCKGIAILINDKKILMNEKNNSHSELGNEDDYLKVNVIYDDREKKGYRYQVDNHGNDQIEKYRKEGYLNPDNSIIKEYVDRLDKFCKDNEHKFFRLFCRLLDSATIKGYQTNNSATIEGNQSNNLATIKGFQSNYLATIEDFQSNYSATIKGFQSNDSATIKGFQSNYLATIEDFQSNDSATIKGFQSNDSATIKGDIILYKTIIKDEKSETSKLIAEFCKDKICQDCTLTNFIAWLKKGG